jgi:hydrogenase maturation protease
MPRTLIVGYGNPLRGDDGLGWQVANHLAETVDHESTNVLAVHQLTPELAEPISKADLVIFIDASNQGQPGSWKCEGIDSSMVRHNVLGHHFTPSSLLAYAEAIFKARPRALVLSVGAESFDYCEKLTPTVERALSEIEQYIRAQVLPRPASITSR